MVMAMIGNGAWINKEWKRVLCELGGKRKVVDKACLFTKKTLHGLRGTADT